MMLSLAVSLGSNTQCKALQKHRQESMCSLAPSLGDSTPKTKTTDTMMVTVTKMKTFPWDLDDSNEDSEEGKRNNILQKAILLYMGKV